MSNHTPGPYTTRDGGNCQFTIYSGETALARVFGYADSSGEPKATARLFAAAPELLRSLDRCAFLLERIAAGDHQALRNAEDAAEMARAAIAKATQGA